MRTRIKLKVFRVMRGMSQHQMAERLDCGRAYYGHVERGFQIGSAAFWQRLQTAFQLTDEQIKELKKID